MHCNHSLYDMHWKLYELHQRLFNKADQDGDLEGMEQAMQLWPLIEGCRDLGMPPVSLRRQLPQYAESLRQ